MDLGLEREGRLDVEVEVELVGVCSEGWREGRGGVR